MKNRKIIPFIQKPTKGEFKTQEEINKENQKKRKEMLKKLDNHKT